MNMFRNINVNLYNMYFRNIPMINCQYDYLKLMYLWNPQAVANFENAPFNKRDAAYKFMKGGVTEQFFSVQFSDVNVLDSPYLFNICFDNLRNSLHLTNNPELSEVIRKIIYESETAVKECFKWDYNVQCQMKQIFEKYNTVQVLCTLLIYAQIQRIYTPDGEYRLKNGFSYVKAYKKEVINSNFSSLLKNAVEINMSQISVPSLIDSYTDFFKRNNKNSIIDILTKNPDFRLNILLIDPSLPNIEILISSYMHGDCFSDGLEVVNNSIKFATELKNQFPKQVTVRTVPEPMSYSFMQIKKIKEPSVVKIDIYTPNTSADDRFSMIFDNLESKELYDYYTRAFYRMFYDGKSI